ncbi:MAG: serine/threonine-protein phosphatase [Muribaculaceae bacterium]|nr:serine/threonine-protein phosphatase [Muribaculaceae bacterium]
MRIKLYPPLAIHEQGNRDNQEDYIYPVLGDATSDDKLFIVCDGMGGHEHGEVASQTFAKSLAEYFNTHASSDVVLPDKLIADALSYAYHNLDAADSGSYKKMGTTLTLLYFHRGGVTAAHIGDSRIYHLRPGKRLLYVSRDHSLVFDLYQSGEITYGEMRTSQQKNVITRAVQPGEDNRVKPDIIHITDVRPGDYFYMCSDGMLEQMDDDDIFGLLSGRGSDEKKMKKLIAATAGNQDNHSAYIIHVEDVKTEECDADITGNEETTAKFNVLNMKPLGDVAANRPDEDDDLTVTAASAPASAKRHTRKKKTLTPLWWALLIAAIVAVAAWLALYGWGGRHDKANDEPAYETVSVHNDEPIKPVIHHSTTPQRNRASSKGKVAEEAAASRNAQDGDAASTGKDSKSRHEVTSGESDNSRDNNANEGDN